MSPGAVGAQEHIQETVAGHLQVHASENSRCGFLELMGFPWC